MRHHIVIGRCPCCHNDSTLKEICTVCHGVGRAITVHLPNYKVEFYPVDLEDVVRRKYPAADTPVHERATVEQAWERFAQMVEIPLHRQDQYREMRRAFYAGVHWVIDELSVQLDPSSETTADDLEYLQRIYAEVQQFNEDIQAGRA
jgi:hypothetical protein